MKKKFKVIGIIITYNCADLVEKTVAKIPKEKLYKLIIVDDGSKDNIKTVAKKLKLPFFSHKHLGYGGNIKFGLKKSLNLGAEYIVEIHGDGQYDPAVILQALNKVKKGYGLILGSRFTNFSWALKDKMSYARFIANIFLSFFDRIILQLPLTEFHSGFRVYDRKLFEKISFQNTSDDYLYSFEIIAQAKYHHFKVGEVPIHCDYSTRHTSMSLKKSAIYFFQTFEVLILYILARFGFKNRLFF